KDLARRNVRLLIVCGGIAVGMVGLSFAAVPLYDLFCRVTGYGGTTRAAEQVADKVVERTITVRFDANTAAGVPWQFKPVQKEITVKLGQVGLAFYEAKNTGGAPTTGTATFNVTPAKAGVYFNKLECFCFTEQTLDAGERVEMPVQFYVDPSLAEERYLDNVNTITLSYTFFPVDKPKQTAQR
ncbi:MAG: cytochrome c oxidase assembly protein, partial [Alphaproteobacteria bacterium]